MPKLWVTQIAKILVGEQPCLLSPWVSAHAPEAIEKRKDGGSLVRWKSEHTALMDATCEALKADGWTLRKEQFMRVEGKSAIVSGKIDIYATKKDCRPLIVDCKSGSNVRESDAAQVLLYMVLVPQAWNAPGMQFNGRVAYWDHAVELTPKDAVDIKERLYATIRKLADPTKPEPSPGRDACRYCFVSAEMCQARESGDVSGNTEEF